MNFTEQYINANLRRVQVLRAEGDKYFHFAEACVKGRADLHSKILVG